MSSDELDNLPNNNTKSEGWGKFVSTMKTGSSQKGQMQREWPTAKMRTISFNLIQHKTVTSVPIKCEALIVFSIAGNSISRRLNVANGSSVSCIAEALDVTLEDHSTSPGFPGVLGEQYEVNITTAPGSRAFGHQAPILQQQGQVVLANGGGTHDWPIPVDAGAIAAFVTIVAAASPGPTNAEIVITESANGFTTRQWDGRSLSLWIPLSPGATNLNITNLSAGTAISAAVQFGIDG